ncbi:MAG: hypothetical protein K8S18_17280 [Desulfobacula sp.]|nr:hypothetical protein [Desulfobacula sp.]
MKKKRALIICLFVILAGCSVVNLASIRMPGTDLGKLKKFYVEKLDSDNRYINKIIKDQLLNMGYEATTGSKNSIPKNIDAVVTYADRWMWDLSNYMIQLTIHIKAPDSDFVIGAGKSYRTSLDRKSPEFMVQEVIESIFKESNQN